MDVSIVERKFSLRSEYDITAPGRKMIAQKAFFSLGSTIELKTPANVPIATIQSQFSLTTHYKFEFVNGHVYDFRTEKVWKGVYVCEGNGLTYSYYQHEGLRASIFQDERQIAALTKSRFVVGDGNEYAVQMNRDANLAVVVCMILAINTADHDDSDNTTFNVDFGSIGPEDKAFDETWTPT